MGGVKSFCELLKDRRPQSNFFDRTKTVGGRKPKKMEQKNMGIHKKPIELKIAQGNPGKRKLPKKKKIEKIGQDFLPDLTLEGYAKEYWDKLQTRLELQGILKITDTMELTMLAYYCGKFKELSEQLKGEDISCMSDKGNAYQNPLWGALNTCQDKIQKMLIQFGMTPAARADVFEELEQPENPFLEL